jgi:hypothetical protein
LRGEKALIVPSAHTFSFKSLLLVQEDIQTVVEAFKSSDANWNVLVSDGENNYGSIDAMRSRKGDEVEHLIVANEDMGVKLELRRKPRVMNLSTFKSTPAAELAFYHMRDFLAGRKRPLNNWFPNRFLWLAWIILAIVAKPEYAHRNEPIHGEHWLVVLLLFSTLGVTFLHEDFEGMTSYFVSLKRRHELPSFLKRKKDDIFLMLIAALLGIVGTLIVQHLTK